jgi:adenylate cyclase
MNSFLRKFLINGAWWTLVIFIWTSVTHSELKAQHEQLDHFVPLRIALTLLSGTVLAFLNSSMEWIIERRASKYKVSFRKKMLLLLIRQLVFITIVAILLYTVLRTKLGFGLVGDFHSFLDEFQVGKFWIYAGVCAYIFEILRAIDQKLGPGNLWKLMIGEFSKPKEMERIFMFLDLKGSTTWAERLGHIKYSELIQDCFHDISVVRNHGAEIFQYVGDEVVLVWKPAQGLSSFNCIEAYFSFMNRIHEKKDYYLKEYGMLPFFKAGVHIGQIVLAEVGEIKREIAYHGDTINTASRIQKTCNEFNQSLVISDKLWSSFHTELSKQEYDIEPLGSVLLKGKDNHVSIMGVSKRNHAA